MKLLLDTHIVLWAMNDNPKLSEKARNLILDSQNEIYYSTASVWETTIKHMSKPEKIMINGKSTPARKAMYLKYNKSTIFTSDSKSSANPNRNKEPKVTSKITSKNKSKRIK